MCIYSCYVFKKRVPCKHYIEPMCFYNTDVRGRLNQCEGIHWNTHAFKKSSLYHCHNYHVMHLPVIRILPKRSSYVIEYPVDTISILYL